MNCKFCGAPLEGEEVFCPQCGERLKEISENPEQVCENPEQVSEDQEQVGENPEQVSEDQEQVGENPEQAPKKKTWKIVLIAGVCLLLAAIVASAVMYALGAGPFATSSEVAKQDSYTVSGEIAEGVAQQVVAVVGDKELTNSELQFYYWSGVSDFVSYYGDYLDTLGLDMSLPLDQQVWDPETGETWQHFFLLNALNVWHRTVTVALQAENAGHQLDADSQATIETMAEQLEEMAASYGYESAVQMIQQDFGPVSDDMGYMSYIKTGMLSNSYYASLYENFMPTDEEVEAHYASNESQFEGMGAGKDAGKTVDVRHILITPEATTNEDGSTTITDDQWEACRVAAQALLDSYLAGDVTEDAFAALAVANSEDPGSASNGGLYTQVQVGQMVEPFENWCFDESRKVGDTGLVKTTYGYHIMYFVGEQQYWFTAAQSDLVNVRTEEFVQEGMTQWPIEIDYKKIALGDPVPAEAETVPATTQAVTTDAPETTAATE